MKTKEEVLFEEVPVRLAVLSLVIPTVISQLITVIYNMADTFFIGQIGDPDQVAAVSLCMPMFVFLTGLANLFGIGGSSLMARSLGLGDQKKAQQTAAFSIWTAALVALFYGVLLFMARPALLPVIGADAKTYGFCSEYIFWVITIFIFPLGLKVAGAAIATMISNVISMLYFILLIMKKQDEKGISFDPRLYTWGRGIPKEVLLVGLPSFLMNLMGVLSNTTINKLMSGYSNAAIAGIGIAKKIDMLSFAIATGMSQGVLPLIAYNYSARNIRRMKAALKVDFLISFSIAVVATVLLFTCAGPIVQAFINDAETVSYGRLFQRIICITGPCISVTMLAITAFQSVGKKLQPTVLSLMRKGGLDIPFMLILNAAVGVRGIVWATPIADLCAMIVAVVLFVPFWRQLSKQG